MSIIKSDFVIKGRHATIVKKLVENGLFSEGYEVFINAILLGLYYGRKSEMDGSDTDKVEISRTIWNSRSQLENSLFTFLQHEKVYQKQPLDVAEVFNMNLESVNTKELYDELKLYALYGIERLGEMYSELMGTTDRDLAIQLTTESYVLEKVQLSKKVIEDKKYFYRADEDEDILSILRD